MSINPSSGNISNEPLKCRYNNPPDPPGDPNPIGPNATICGNLSWNCSDPDGDDLTFDVWFGDVFNMNQVAWDQTENWFWIYDLDFVKRYYWYIVAWDEHGAYTVGPIWNFRTEANLPPNPAEDPYPPDGDIIPLDEGVILCWNGSDPNLCDTLRFNLYFDDVNPPLTQALWQTYNNCWGIPFTLTK